MPEKRLSMNCQWCGKLFSFPASERDERKYCSPACQYEAAKTPDSASRLTTNCPVCGKEFWYYPNERPETKTHYCSVECSNIGQSQKIEMQCPTCGKTFFIRPSFVKRGGKFCSRKCYLKSISINKTRVCEHCGKQFEIKCVSQLTKYCSNDCKFAARRGEQHPLWLGGISREPYPWVWGRELKKTIKNRDGNRCRECNATMKLRVHHINYIKKDCRHDNLITLCSSCHGKTNFNREYWKDRYEKMIRRTNSSTDEMNMPVNNYQEIVQYG